MNLSRPGLLMLLAMLMTPIKGFADESTDRENWKIVNYWSITCAPCRIEIPELNSLSKELAQENVPVLGVNFDEDDRDTTMRIAGRLGIEFPTLTQATVESMRLDPPNVLPTTYIVNPEGEIMATLIGAQTSESIRGRLAELRAASQ